MFRCYMSSLKKGLSHISQCFRTFELKDIQFTLRSEKKLAGTQPVLHVALVIP